MEERMSENTAETTAPEGTEQGNPEMADEALGDAGKKALDAMKAKWKEAEKQSAALKSKLDEISRANESTLERAQREAEEAKAEVERVPQLVADHLRVHLAAAYGISDDDRELYLTSNDPEVLLKQVTGLAARASDTTAAAPRPDLTQGGSGAPLALNSDGLEDALKTKLGIA